MKFRKNRFLCMALCVTMLLTACGGKEPSESTVSSDSGLSQDGSSNVEDAGNEEGQAEGADQKESSLWLDEELEITILMQDNAAQPLTDYAPAQQEIHRKTNVKLVYQIVPTSSYTEKENVLLATNNFPDIIKVSAGNINSYAGEGIFEIGRAHV